MKSFPCFRRVRLATVATLAIAAAAAGAAAQSRPATFDELLARPLELRPERRGQHPRIFFAAADLDRLREAAARDPKAWQAFLDASEAIRREPPPASRSQERGLLYRVGLTLPEPAFAFAVTRDPKHLAQARTWIETLLTYEPWGYTYSKPDQDIPAGHALYGLALAYDLLHGDLTADEHRRIRATLTAKARRLYEAYEPRPGRRYSFSQNHTYINAAAIGFAALALDADTHETRAWLSFMRAVLDRTLATYARDGSYYEGYHYFEFSVPWIVHALDALEFNTTDRPYDRVRLDLSKHYVAHSLLSRGLFFDFGDAGRGADDRLAGRSDLDGAHALLYRLAERYADPDARAVADWASERVARTREPMWAFIWKARSQALPRAAAGIGAIPLVHHFTDGGVVFARSAWDADAPAVAFKCGPPEGHRAATLVPLLLEWRQSTGHAHPDAGSFIVFARGAYLTGDAGYTGVKMTSDHNALLIDGRGQANDGRHEVFPGIPLDRLDKIRLTEVKAIDGGVRAVCNGTTAFDPDLGVVRWERTFTFDGRDRIDIADVVETRRPRAVTVLLHHDRAIERRGDGFVLASPEASLVATIDPSGLDARIEPHFVITQGRPGSVEKGELEQRGTVLRLTTPPATRTDVRMRLQITDGTTTRQ